MIATSAWCRCAGKLAADRAGRVGLVCDHRVGAGAGSALAVAWEAIGLGVFWASVLCLIVALTGTAPQA
ncbi:MAG: hypothetical protein CME34_14305 [Gordonia sp.]|nr:hypothetical protein [Gordonia sp. (in: high G+C Gram-positive bacteria)]